MSKIVRWKQRFENLLKAHAQLNKGVAIAMPTDIEQQGIIQSFEFTFELSWKTMKDYLESKGVNALFPRDVIKEAFQSGIVGDGEVWLEMLDQRNVLTHTYDQKLADAAVDLIRSRFTPAIHEVVAYFHKEYP